MGFAVVHMQKFKASGLRGLQSHNNREHPPKSNPDIDFNRTEMNYSLIACENYSRAVKNKINEYASNTKTVRKDAVVFCSFVVTSDEATMKAMSEEEQRSFFEDTLKWFSNRYGSENIVNATVHMDETTPHMHIGIVPITEDKRLCAKKLFDKFELKSIQTDFASEVGRNYGLKRGIEGSERTHLTEAEFKITTAAKRLEKIENQLQTLNDEFTAKKDLIIEASKSSEQGYLFPDYATVEKRGLFHKEETITVPINKWIERSASTSGSESLEKAFENFEKTVSGKKASDKISALNDTISALKDEFQKILSQNEVENFLRKSKDVEKEKERKRVEAEYQAEIKSLSHKVEFFEKAISRLSDEAFDELNGYFEDIKNEEKMKNRRKSRDNGLCR